MMQKIFQSPKTAKKAKVEHGGMEVDMPPDMEELEADQTQGLAPGRKKGEDVPA